MKWITRTRIPKIKDEEEEDIGEDISEGESDCIVIASRRSNLR